MREFWKLFSTLAAVAIVATVIIPYAPLNAQEKGKAAPKNLKVLKPENYMDQMLTYAAALGVEAKAATSAMRQTAPSTRR